MELQLTPHDTNQSKEDVQSEVGTMKSVLAEGDESPSTGQVAASTGVAQEASSGDQPLAVPSGQQFSHNNRENENESPHDKTIEQTQITCRPTEFEIEDKITTNVTQKLQTIMESFSNNIRNMIREEIKTTTKPISVAEQHITQEPTPQEHSRKDNELWSVIAAKPPTTTRRDNARTETTTIVGTRKFENGNDKPPTGQLQAADRRAWLYIGKLHHSTTEEAVRKHLTSIHVNNIIECEELQSKGTLKAFKVVIPMQDLIKVNTAEAWPEGVVVRRYRLFRSQGTVARLAA
ncbi:hypothetical protein C0J52_19985 [Blattella germanica]|nr:hypothetical protein C0J52_19985 [Blattella germanica]